MRRRGSIRHGVFCIIDRGLEDPGEGAREARAVAQARMPRPARAGPRGIAGKRRHVGGERRGAGGEVIGSAATIPLFGGEEHRRALAADHRVAREGEHRHAHPQRLAGGEPAVVGECVEGDVHVGVLRQHSRVG
jgi:hypothetical protein